MMKMRSLSEEERLDWLQLIRTPNIGPITFHRLIEKFGDARAALEALPDLSGRAGARSFKVAPRDIAENDLANAQRHGAQIIAACEPTYPQALRAIADHPPVVYLRGHASLFEKPAVAIIGARNASAAGRKMARSLAADLGAAGVVVVSGLARGIDGAAHEASLPTGSIAVVAGGLDVIYPPEHGDLTERIAREGALISETPTGYQPTARDFPRRNRLISGLSHGVVVVEAAAKSGTLITARFALEQGREVFAVPGSPLDPRSHGANALLRDGAALVERAQDILDGLRSLDEGIKDRRRDLYDWDAERDDENEPSQEIWAGLREQVLELLSFAPIHSDEIRREIDAPPGMVADVLLELVLTGEAVEHHGGLFSLNVD